MASYGAASLRWRKMASFIKSYVISYHITLYYRERRKGLEREHSFGVYNHFIGQNIPWLKFVWFYFTHILFLKGNQRDKPRVICMACHEYMCRDACRDRQLAVSYQVCGGENVPGLTGSCTIRNFIKLVRGPWIPYCWCTYKYAWFDLIYMPGLLYWQILCVIMSWGDNYITCR